MLLRNRLGQSTFDTALLEPEYQLQEPHPEFSACLNAHGVYNTEQFVLRLSSRIHKLVDAIVTDVATTDEIDDETFQAFSTYLHETVHWWQHVGSTSGLVLSLQYPAQAHQNQEHLRLLLNRIGPKKPLRRWAEQQARSAPNSPELRAANIAVNNATDSEYYKRIALRPRLIEQASQDRYFESLGHCYWMAYGHALALLHSTVDAEIRHLPDGRRWDEGFRIVREAETEGFVHGGQVRVSSIGMLALYEGQARFAQLQFLTFGMREPPTLETLRQARMLDGVYGEAFDAFLAVTGASPTIVDAPAVALFMLLLDLAINPTRGLPLDIENFSGFILDVDPGIRFYRLCHAVRDRPEFLNAINEYSRSEYFSVSSALSEVCGFDCPAAALQEIVRWIHAPGVAKLLAEKVSFSFEPANLVVRVLFSHFVSFSSDKLNTPEFFCWPGAWMAGPRVCDLSQTLFLRYLSLFSDKADDGGIYPRRIPGVPEENLVTTLSIFYGNITVYDLTRQWTLFDGPFAYDYRWLSETHTDAEMVHGAKQVFERIYGVNPDNFEVLS